MGRKRKELRNVTGLTCLFEMITEFRNFVFAAVQDQFQYATVQTILVPPHFVCSEATALCKLPFSKQKLSQTALMQLQYLQCLRNVYDQITLLICRQMISC